MITSARPNQYPHPENDPFSEIKLGFRLSIMTALTIYGSFSGCNTGHFLGGELGN
jgi:hypothetical protein